MSKPIETITEEEFQKLVEAVYSTRDVLLLYFMFDAGLRVSEVCQLEIRDISYISDNAIPKASINDFVNLVVKVRAENSKNKESRDVPMSDRLRNRLMPYIGKFYINATPALDQPLFAGCNGRKYLSARAVQKLVEYLSTKFIGRRIHPHILRHSFATRLMQKAPLAVVSKLLGHKNKASTLIYMHPVLSDLQKAIREI